MPDPTPPPYLPAVLDLAGRLPRGTLSDLFVLHDDDCPLLAGAGPCACKPAVTLGYRLWFRARRGKPWEAVAVAPTAREAWQQIQASGRTGGDWCVLPSGYEP